MEPSPVSPIDDEARAWCAAAPAADAHADSLLWNRDLSVAAREGHADFPRLIEGGVRLQAFTIATRGLPVIDGMGFFLARRGWPRAARRSPLARALYQAEQLARFTERSGGTAAIARTRADLDAHLAPGRLACVLGVEGASALEGDLANLRRLFDLGVRFVGPSHLIPNAYASCSFWLYRDRGLSAQGRELVAEMARLGMAVDLAHASPRAFDEILETAPPSLAAFDSHTGVNGARAAWRNLSDAQLRAIAARDGVVSIILARNYLGGSTTAALLRHVRHAIAIAGASRVAIGSDFDGFIRPTAPIRDARDFPAIAAALRDAGIPRADALGVLGANLIRFFRRALPAGPPEREGRRVASSL